MTRTLWPVLLIAAGLIPGAPAHALPGPAPRPVAVAPTQPTKGPGALAGVTTVKPVSALRQMQVDPARLDFPPLWSGESARKTVSFIAPVAGTVSATAPQIPFAIAEIRVVAADLIPTGNSKMPLTHLRARRIAPPWQVNCTQGDQVQVDVAFAPVFDLFQMAAGAKSAALALHGPSTYGSWDASVPLAGMFNGKRLLPLMLIPDADSTVTVSPTTPSQVHFNIRFVSTGEPFQATVEAYDTPRFGLRGTEWKVSVPSGGTVELPMWVVVNPAHCCSWSPANDEIKAYYHQGSSQGTISAAIRWTIVPDPYTWKNFSGGCNFVTIAGDLTLASSGVVTLAANQWSIATEPETSTFEFTFNGLGKPLSRFEVTAPPLPGQKTFYNFRLDVGPPSGNPSPAFFAAARNGPSLTCAN